MSVVGGSDERTLVPAASVNDAMVAIDTVAAGGGFIPGSGYMIGANFALTANHVMGGNAAGRITLGSAVNALPSRANPPTAIAAADLNIAGVTIITGSDMALVKTNAGLIGAGGVLGLLLAYDPQDLKTLPVSVTGFPWIVTDPVLSVNVDNSGRTAYTASGTINAATATDVTYTQTLDTEGGQSGSGLILDKSGLPAASVLASIDADLVLGAHTNGAGGDPATGFNLAQTLTEIAYWQIGEAMKGDGDADALPRNVLLGLGISDVGPPPPGGDDYIMGSFRRELIIGQSGDDRIVGGGGDDEIIGGFGVDQALFSGLFSDYDFFIDNPAPGAFGITFSHSNGGANGVDMLVGVEFAVFEYEDLQAPNQAGFGVDDDGDVFFVPLAADPDDPTKLKDGPDIDVSEQILDADGDTIGSLTAELPAFMFDGDLDFKLSIGAEENVLYNFIYIVDSSGSMSGDNIVQTKSAYAALTRSLIDQGVADRANFAVVDFDSSATLIAGLDAQAAIDVVNALEAGGGTDFGPALDRAEAWFESLANVDAATNIAFFLSDGFGSGASSALQIVNDGQPDQAVVDVRAFGIGSGADLSSLDLIDSNSAVALVNPADLVDAFAVSGIDRDSIDHIDVSLNGTVVQQIAPASLVDGPLGLTFEGSLEGLEVSRTAENLVEFEIIFNNGTPSAVVSSKVTTGQTEIRAQTSDGTQEVVTFSVIEADYIVNGESEIVHANDFDNEITVNDGAHEINGNGGDDRFILLGGTTIIDGGDGIDSAVFAETQAAAGGVTRSGDLVRVGSAHTLLDVEYIEFADGRIETATLTRAPLASIAARTLSVSEADAGVRQAIFEITLDGPATAATTLSFATRDGSATAGADYAAVSGAVVFAIGETVKQVAIDILQDTLSEGMERLFVDFELQGGATFAGDATTAVGMVEIEDDEAVISASIAGENAEIEERTGDTPSVVSITVSRTGDLAGGDVVGWAIAGIGDAPATAGDFVGGVVARSVSFAAGETSKIIEIAVVGDDVVEGDERFEVAFTQTAGTSTLIAPTAVFTILDDDIEPMPEPEPEPEPEPTSLFNRLIGSSADERLIGGAGRDLIRGKDGADLLRGFLGNDRLHGGANDDLIAGNGGRDELRGARGDDRMQGGRGADLLIGGHGVDVLRGGGGDDEFRIFAHHRGFDRLRDFAPGEDIVVLAGYEPGLGVDDLRFERGEFRTRVFLEDDLLAVIDVNPEATLTRDSFEFI